MGMFTLYKFQGTTPHGKMKIKLRTGRRVDIEKRDTIHGFKHLSVNLHEVHELCSYVTIFERMYLRREIKEIGPLVGSLFYSAQYREGGHYEISLFRGFYQRHTGKFRKFPLSGFSMGYLFFRILRDALERLGRFKLVTQEETCIHRQMCGQPNGECDKCRVPTRP